MNSAPDVASGDPFAVEAGESKIDFRAYWRTIRKRWPFVILSVIVATVIAFVFTYRQPKIYEAQTLIEFDPDVRMRRALEDELDVRRREA